MEVELEFETFKKDVLKRLKEELQDIEDFPFDFNSNVLHDVIHEEVDSFVAGMTRNECLTWIDFCDNEEYIDKGVIDNSSIDRQIMTTTFECIRQKLFDTEELFFDLQQYEMTEQQRNKFISRINQIIGKHKHTQGKHSKTQIWIKTGFEIEPELFKEPYFAKEQIVDLSNGIKILTNNKSINRNAIVFQKDGNKQYRVYLMEKDRDIDIRDFFKYKSVGKPDFILNPAFYIKGNNEPIGNKYPYKIEFEDKREFVYYINQMVTELNKRE